MSLTRLSLVAFLTLRVLYRANSYGTRIAQEIGEPRQVVSGALQHLVTRGYVSLATATNEPWVEGVTHVSARVYYCLTQDGIAEVERVLAIINR